MSGTQGRLTVRLAAPAVVTAVTIDHASPLVAVSAVNSKAGAGSASAPKRFSIFGLATAPVNGVYRAVAVQCRVSPGIALSS